MRMWVYAFMGLRMYVDMKYVCIAYVTLRTYVLYVCLDSYSHCPVSCSLLSWLKRKTIIFLCCQERRRRRGRHSISALMVGVTPPVCLWCVVAVCGTHMSTLSPFDCVYFSVCNVHLLPSPSPVLTPTLTVPPVLPVP